MGYEIRHQYKSFDAVINDKIGGNEDFILDDPIRLEPAGFKVPNLRTVKGPIIPSLDLSLNYDATKERFYWNRGNEGFQANQIMARDIDNDAIDYLTSTASGNLCVMPMGGTSIKHATVTCTGGVDQIPNSSGVNNILHILQNTDAVVTITYGWDTAMSADFLRLGPGETVHYYRVRASMFVVGALGTVLKFTKVGL